MLAIIALIAAVIGAFLYLRILVTIWLTQATEQEDNANLPIPFEIGLVLVISVIATMFLGIWPEPLVEMVERAIPVLVAS